MVLPPATQLRLLGFLLFLREQSQQYRLRNQRLSVWKLKFDEIELPVELKECQHVYQMYTIKVKKVARRDFILGLRKKGIMASVHFSPPVHLQQYYANRYKSLIHNLAVTERVASSIVTLPMYPGLRKNELDYMVNAIGKVLHTLNRRII